MRSDPVYRERLLRLASFLEALPPERFYFGTWIGSDWEGKPDLSCGTTACALGWATTIPEFRALGLRLVVDHAVRMPAIVDHDGFHAWSDQSPAEASMHVFGLDSTEHEYLFVPRYSIIAGQNLLPRHAPASAVVARIREFVASHAPVSDPPQEERT